MVSVHLVQMDFSKRFPVYQKNSFSILQILHGARLALSGNSPISGRVPCDENECVGLIRGGSCLHFLLLTPAYSSQIVLRTAYDYFAPQEVILV